MTTDLPARVAELLPCPFCGAKAEIRPNQIGDYFVICYADEPDEYACGACTSDVNCETPEKAVRRWNKRVTGTGDDVLAGVAKLAGTITQSKITFLGVDGAEVAYRFPSDILAHAFDGALRKIVEPAAPTDGWIEWKGGDVAPLTGVVDVKQREMGTAVHLTADAVCFDWTHDGGGKDILFYRRFRHKLAGE